MKTLGLIGGMSWESTIPYYRQINEAVKQALGGLHSAKIILYSVNFYDIERLQHAGQWAAAGDLLAAAAKSLEAAGAQALVLCTNTMHKVAPAIEDAVDIPLLHIADPTAEAIKTAGVKTVGLLGTRFTMEQDFYRSRLEVQHGLTVLTPDRAGRDLVHNVIYDELCLGRVMAPSRIAYLQQIDALVAQGAEAVILGCTEIGLLITPDHTQVPLFDTTGIHANEAAKWALQP